MTRRVMMPKNFNQEIIDAVNKYDDQPTIEQQVINYSPVKVQPKNKKNFTAEDNYKLLKSVANQQEKKEFRDIERKYKKIKPQKIKGKVYGARDFVFVNKTEPLNIDITPLPQMRPLSVDNLKGFFTAGTKPKVSEGLAKILGVDND